MDAVCAEDLPSQTYDAVASDRGARALLDLFARWFALCIAFDRLDGVRGGCGFSDTSETN